MRHSLFPRGERKSLREKKIMASTAADHQVPTITISSEILRSGRECKEWGDVAERVRDACEQHGWFLVECDEIPLELQEKVLEVAKDMFDFPKEKKQMYKKASQLEGGYQGSNAFIPLYESFGINSHEEFRALEEVLWPGEGRAVFLKVFDSVNESVLRLCLVLLRMISDSYGLREYYEEKAFDENLTCNVRAIKYRLPKIGEEGLGLRPHVDKNYFAILFQNSVQGLQVLTRDGNWISPNIPKGALVVSAGDALQVLSNRRIRALKHRVIMSGTEERYSCVFFFIPKKEITMEVPPQLIDDSHPPHYRSFVYTEYREKCLYNTDSDALDNYAGIS